MGGLVSVYAALNRPDIFGLVGTQSGALAYGNSSVIRQIQFEEFRDIRFHVTVGSYETQIAGTGPEANFLVANDRFVEQLEAKGYDHFYEVSPQGHSWGFWQSTLGDSLVWLFGE